MKLQIEYGKDRGTDSIEPVGLVEACLQIKIDGSACGTPQAIIVRSDDSELIATGPQICIVSNATRAAINPVTVESFELVFESDLFRSHETERSVIKVETAFAR